MKVGKITFDMIMSVRSTRDSRLDLEEGYDIVLYNSYTILIAIVEYVAHPNDVDKLLNKNIPNFKKLYPEYKDFKFYGAIAGLSMPKKTIRRAVEYGFFVLTQSGENIKLLNDKVKCY